MQGLLYVRGMKKIYKYELIATTDHLYSVTLPEDFKILTVSTQYGQLQCWAEVDPDVKMRSLSLLIVVTGGEVPSEYTYVSTIFEGPYVLHAYVERWD